MDRAGSRRREADADLACPFRVCAGHEGRHLLVADLDELELVRRPVERADDRVDAVAGVPVDPADPVFVEPPEQEIGGGLAHGASFGEYSGLR